ncbi:uncharacterized protein Z519_08625 [Cladophialophora bantiana CBS 173.52]|uniref:Transmembrane protein 53 n=1 Tax=Cladophialophora bantiana (strain ATCC 10958 / CBS 173.52 / CDC B-1940 / NIH 8579) TaxID=1442370 RepID=A0A0D2FWD8_CLAB1|nr:uncharacterized protein Z519_08625 [Cladophialophora bantiana CBS 173.52]KIW90842.1 hypothetical protein Z519_08625 [Cladophialophora bantiana CBS 173.52]
MEFAGPEPELQSGEEPEAPRMPCDPHLADFTQLGSQIYIYTPPAPSVEEINGAAEAHQRQQEQRSLDPDLIIVCSWMYAQSRNIGKYIKVYQTTYPSSPILLLRQDGGDFFFRTKAQQMRNLTPAVSLIRDLSAKKEKNKEGQNKGKRLKVLCHVFSNGGAWTVCQLADAYYHHQQKQQQEPRQQLSSPVPCKEIDVLLPITVLVLDSTPSLPNVTASHTAICEALSKSPPALRALGSVLVWGYLGVSHVVGAVAGREDVTLSLRRRLNHPRGAFTQPSLRARVYIYSQADALIAAADVEAHAREAAQVLTGGRDRVRLEDFGESRHVGHVLADPARYWAIIESLWRESCRGSGQDSK